MLGYKGHPVVPQMGAALSSRRIRRRFSTVIERHLILAAVYLCPSLAVMGRERPHLRSRPEGGINGAADRAGILIQQKHRLILELIVVAVVRRLHDITRVTAAAARRLFL